jgi:hypothetical protein
VFGSKCYIKREDNKIGKFDSRVDKGILVGYSRKRKAYKCYNLRLNKIVESINVNIDETNVLKTREERKNSKRRRRRRRTKRRRRRRRRRRRTRREATRSRTRRKNNNQQDFQTPSRTPNHWVQKNHPLEQIIGDKNAGIETRGRKQACTPEQRHLSLLSTVEPNNFEEANNDEHWIKAMEEELNQIEKNETWELVPRPKDKNVIGTKWVFRNKLNEGCH